MTEQTDRSTMTLRRRGQRRWASRPTRVVAVDFDGQTLRLARAVRRGAKARITRLASRPLPSVDEVDPADAAALGQWLGGVLRELKFKDPLVMAVPRARVLFRSITLPGNTTADELPAMARFQVSKDLPVASDEAVIDLALQTHFDGTPSAEPSDDDSSTQAKAEGEAPADLDVLAAAVRHETIDYYREVAEAAGGKLLALGMRSHAQARCIEACDGVDTHQRTCVFHVRPAELLIDVLAGTDLTFTRAVQLASEGMNVERMATEAVRNLRSYEATQPQGKVDRMLVSGGTGMETELATQLGEQLRRPCETLDLAKALELVDASTDDAAGSVAAMGLAIGALDDDGLPFDFLHPHETPPQRDNRKLIAALVVAAVIGLVVTGYGVRQSMLGEREEMLANLTSEIREMERNVRFFRESIRDYETLAQWEQRHQPWIDHLAYLSGILPESERLYVTQLSTAPSGAMRVGVQARDPRTLNRVDERLREAGYGPRPMAVTPGNDRHGYPFRATLELTPPTDLDVDLAEHQPSARPEDDGSLD